MTNHIPVPQRELEQQLESALLDRAIANNLASSMETVAKNNFEMWQSHKETVEIQARELAALTQECEAYRSGGVTEELLRKGDGFLKVGTGCTVVRSEEWDALTARVRELEQRLKTFACEKCFCNMMISCAENDPLAVPCGSAGKQEWCKCGYCDIEIQLTALTQAHQQAVKERDDYKAEVEVGLQLTGSFFEALKPLNLTAINVTNPGRHVSDLIENSKKLCSLNADLKAHLQQAVEALAVAEVENICLHQVMLDANDRLVEYRLTLSKIANHSEKDPLADCAMRQWAEAALATHKDIEHHPACSVCGYTDSEGVPQPPACHPDCLATHKEKG